MNEQLDTEIRRAIAELADSAPLPRPAAAGEPIALSTRRVAPRQVAMLAVAAAIAMAGIIVAVGGQSSDRITTTPVPTITTAKLGEPAAAYAPVHLPSGVVVWDVAPVVFGPPAGFAATTQLFGQYDTIGTSIAQGVLVTVTRDTRDVAPGTPTVSVHGSPAYVRDSSTTSLFWPTNGFVAEVRSKGMTLGEVTALLDTLHWRDNQADGFDPASAPASHRLISEQHSSEQPAIIYQLTTDAGPDQSRPVSKALGTVFVGGFDGAVRPELVFDGKTLNDGTVVSATTVTPSGNSLALITSDGSAIKIVGTDALPVDAIRNSLQLVDAATIAAVADTASNRLRALPALHQVQIGAEHIISRGYTADAPLALCLKVNETEKCRHVVFGPGGPTTGTVIDGVWYAYGNLSSARQYVLYEWSKDLPPFARIDSARILYRKDVTEADTTWFVAPIPAGIDYVVAGIEQDGMFAPYSKSSALRRPR